MSDGRTILLTSAALLALAGIVVATASALALRDPVWIGGEIGEQRDVSRVLRAALVLGVLLLVAGVTTVTGLIRAQMRQMRPPAG